MLIPQELQLSRFSKPPQEQKNKGILQKEFPYCVSYRRFDYPK